MSDYEKLRDRQLDAAVAEKIFNLEHAGSWLRYVGPDNLVYASPAKNYSTDDNAVRLVRDRIAELGLWPQFVSHVLGACDLAPEQPEASQTHRCIWAAMQATPRQQCLAALMALETK